MERIQKIIANNGYCSRRKAEELIQQGKVKLNNRVVRELGTLASNDDIIEVNDYVIEHQEKVYILLNKPRGVVTTTSDDKNRKTVVDLIANKKIDVIKFVDKIVSLNEVQEAFIELTSGQSDSVKILIDPNK